MRTNRVDRMRRHRRNRGRGVMPTPVERWSALIGATGLDIITGPYPADADQAVPLPPAQAAGLRWAQCRLGVAMDGVLGPQTWAALAASNDARVRRMDGDLAGLHLPLNHRERPHLGGSPWAQGL